LQSAQLVNYKATGQLQKQVVEMSVAKELQLATLPNADEGHNVLFKFTIESFVLVSQYQSFI
jgi:hypothetical protein